MRQTPKMIPNTPKIQAKAGNDLPIKTKKQSVYRSDRELPKLRCPECNARLLDAGSVSVRHRTRLFLYSSGDVAQFVIKCRACGCSIGIDSTSAEQSGSETPTH